MTSTSAPAALVLNAYYDFHKGPTVLQGVKFSARVATLADAEALVALFPKSARLRACTLSGDADNAGYVDAVMNLTPNGTNGERNETGEKRYHAIIARAAKAGVEIVYVKDCMNAYPTREAFEANLAA